MGFLGWIVLGLIAGAIAKLIMPVMVLAGSSLPCCWVSSEL
jgi:uncharacterized membrane protein YeaQ/YmgE (transglycosylase-associated protein family)